MNKNIPGLLFLLALVLAFACETPTRGCLDIEAENFDPSADKQCEDGCCKYPNMVCSISIKHNAVSWKADTAYQNSAGQWYRIKSVAFYLSGFQMFKDNTPIEVIDSIGLKYFGTSNDTLTRVFRDDFLLFRRGGTLASSPVGNEVGFFRSSGAYNRARLQIGLDDDANRIVSKLVSPGSHPLARQADSLWLSPAEGFVWMRLVVARDTVTGTTPDTIDLTAADFGGNPLVVTGDESYYQEVGYDLNFSFVLDFYELTSGINFLTAPISTWKSKIIANLPNSVLITK